MRRSIHVLLSLLLFVATASLAVAQSGSFHIHPGDRPANIVPDEPNNDSVTVKNTGPGTLTVFVQFEGYDRLTRYDIKPGKSLVIIRRNREHEAIDIEHIRLRNFTNTDLPANGSYEFQ